MSKISFIQAGLFTTVQDGGRRGYQSLGMPTAGAMDTYAFSLANALVGNDINQSAIEATLLGPTIEIETAYSPLPARTWGRRSTGKA